MRWPGWIWLVVPALAGPAAVPALDRAADLRAALERPLSPGSVAMLIDYRDEPAARERWAQALRDARADVRAAAARLVNVAAVSELVPDLGGTLQSEQDAAAALEEFTALAALGGPEWDEPLFAAAKRLGGRFPHLLVERLGRRGHQAFAVLARLRELGPGPLELRRFLELATGGDKGALSRVGSQALREKEAGFWEAVLGAARATGGEVDQGLIITALGIDTERFRELTCWHLALGQEKGSAPPSPEVRQAVDSAEAAATAAGDAGAGFACEVIQRALGRRPVESRARLETIGSDGVARVPIHPAILAQLEPGEKKALEARLGFGIAKIPMRAGLATQRVAEEKAPGMRLLDLSAFPKGFVTDLLATAGCGIPKTAIWGGAEIEYGASGRPRRVAFLPSPSLKECEPAAHILLTAGLDRVESSPSGWAGLVLLRLDREYVDCALEAGHAEQGADLGPQGIAAGTAVRPRGRIQEPKKVRHVAPVYPEAARQARQEGVVILEAVISPSGCVRALDVIRGAAPSLEASALQAVSGWRYTPTLLNGKAVPVVMTITVNFILN